MPGRVARAAVVAAVAVLAARASLAIDFYVDAVSGSDVTGNGSAAAPWRSVTYAISTAVARRVGPIDVWIAPGIYDAANGESFPLGGTGGGGGWTLRLHGSRSGTSVVRAVDAVEMIELTGFEGNCADCLVEDLALQCTGNRCLIGVYLETRPVATVRRCRIEGFRTGIDAEFDTIFQSDWQGANVEANEILRNGIGILYRAQLPWNAYLTVSGELTNNLLIGNGVGIRVEADFFSSTGGSLVVGPQIWNNTLVGSTGSAIEHTVWSTGGPGAIADAEIGNNVIAASGGYGIDDGATAAEDPSLIGANLFWQNAMGDARRWVNAGGNRFADPLFVNPAGGDFHPGSGSPCIDRGTDPGPALTLDLEGNARPLDGDGDRLPVIDIGAYEVTGPAASAVDLRRASFSSLAPLFPDRASAFPFVGSNPRTPVVRASFLSGYVDVGSLRDTSFPLAYYHLDQDVPRDLLLAKERWPPNQPTQPLEVRFHLR